MMRKCIFSLALSLLVLLPSCAKKTVGAEYVPLSESGRSEYTVRYMGSGTGMQFGKMIVRADGKEIIDGKEYIKKVEEYSGLPGRDTRITYYRSSAEGIYKINGKHKEMLEYVSTPFPLEVGTKWIVHEPEGEFHFSVVAKETVELMNTKYRDCLIVPFTAVIDSSQIVGVSYLAPNIGVVKNTLKYPNGAMEFLLEKYTK